MPRDGGLDWTRDLLRDPYGFITKGWRRRSPDVFATRIGSNAPSVRMAPDAGDAIEGTGLVEG